LFSFSKYPLIYTTTGLITGLILSLYIHLSFITVVILLAVSFNLLIAIHRLQKSKVKPIKSLPALIYITAVLTGFLLHFKADERNRLSHYTRYLNEKETVKLTIELKKPLRNTTGYHNWTGQVTNVNTHKTTGKILLKIPDSSARLKTGSLLHILTGSEQIKKPPGAYNPYSFSYRDYLKTQGIYRQINLKNTAFETGKVQKNNLFRWASEIRQKIKNYLKSNGLNSKQLALANSLLLGDRQELSAEILKDFKSAGTIHILAISGLHIGILLVFLNFLFYPVKRYSQWLYLSLILLFLWLYAFMTGFSPSVLRAVIMFSFLQTGLMLKRRSNVYNSLFAAALLLLIINPDYLFQVGFQMSFAAVFSIVSFYPLFEKIFVSFSKPLLNYIKDLFLVSLSAQLGILPVSLFYFHQFPVYFWLANLLIIPLLFVVLSTGFGLMILALLNINWIWAVKIFGLLLNTLMLINHQIGSWKFSLIQNIRFPFEWLLIGISGLFIFYYFLKNRKKYFAWASLLLWIITMQTAVLYNRYQRKKQRIFYVLHQYQTPVVAMGQGNILEIYQEQEKINPYLRKALQSQYSKIRYKKQPVFQDFAGKKILHIDSLNIYQYTDYQPDIIILHHSPKINFERMIRRLQPRQIIADASNYPSAIRLWKKTARKYKIPFYDIHSQGAFVLKK